MPLRWGLPWIPAGYPRHPVGYIVEGKTLTPLETPRTPVVNRLKHQGRLAAVTWMLEEGRDCKEVVTRALDRAG